MWGFHSCCLSVDRDTEGEGAKNEVMSERVMWRPNPSSSRCLERGRRSGMCELSILLPFRFKLRSVDGSVGISSVRRSAGSISWDLESMARFRYTSDLAAGCVERKDTTEEPERKEHFERLRCVNCAVLGMDWRAEEVILVCATSKCVRCGRRGSKMSNVEEGRIVHSCRESRVIGNTDGRDGEAKATAKESLNEAEELAQKSKAFRKGREQKRVVRTSELISLSMCSWARNS